MTTCHFPNELPHMYIVSYKCKWFCFVCARATPYGYHDGSNHSHFHRLFNCLFMHTSQHHQSSIFLALVRGIFWWLVDSPHNGPVMQKTFPCCVIILLFFSFDNSSCWFHDTKSPMVFKVTSLILEWLQGCPSAIWSNNAMVSCQTGLTCHAYAWQIGPFWQDTLKWRILQNWSGPNHNKTWIWNNVMHSSLISRFYYIISEKAFHKSIHIYYIKIQLCIYSTVRYVR